MAIQYFDLGNSLAKGAAVGERVNYARQQNALSDVFKQYGPGIMNGDQAALNALAAIDPMTALSVNNNVMARRQAEEDRNYQRGRDRKADDRAQWEHDIMVKEYAESKSAAELQAEIDQIDKSLAGASHFYEQGDQQGYADFLRAQGIKPEEFPFKSFPAYAQKFTRASEAMAGVLERKKTEYGFNDGNYYDKNNPQAGAKPIPGMPAKAEDEYGRYVQEEQSAGRKPLSRIEFGKAKQASSEISVGADGSIRIIEGGGAGGSDTAGLDVSGPGAMIRSIDGILGDDALDWSTGFLSFMQQVPGTGGRRVGARIEQLNGQAFLNAFQSLKGGGQITEIEGQKATAAIGRLDSAQKPEDYRGALEELRGLLVLGQSRPKGWVGNREQDIPEAGAVEGGYRFIGGDPARPESWEKVE